MSASIQNTSSSEELPWFRPFVDILESPQAFTVVLDLPGVTQDQISVSVEGGALEVEARRNGASSSYRYLRSFSLPDSIERDKISADYKAGVLTVVLPKSAGHTPRRIEIKAA